MKTRKRNHYQDFRLKNDANMLFLYKETVKIMERKYKGQKLKDAIARWEENFNFSPDAIHEEA